MIHQSFIQLSDIFKKYLQNDTSTPYYDNIQKSIHQAEVLNPWFIRPFVHTMLSHISHLISKESIENYIADFKTASHPKNILVVAAGNIPMVSFHDVMTVLLSGHTLILKPSSKDTILMKMILQLLQDIRPNLKNKIFIVENTISTKNIDAVIATGTNNTALYFHQYFAQYPRIVRNNRTSIAIIDETTTDEDLKKLADDILLYFGMGCRNVSKIFIPKNFDIQRIFKSIYNYRFVMQHHKYMNNYDYYRSIYLLNKENFLENNFLIVKESEQLHAPVANLFYQTYTDINEPLKYIQNHQNEIQTIVGKNYTPFGMSQFPNISDFSDGINTKNFLMEI
ncbi:MAG: acyl-CoA reductase [Bacteroidetes bacterium]|nr:MAG: acyl-CoA reductase [Bacteroidota bacterium]